MTEVDKLSVRDVSGGAVIAVKVVPSASRDKVAGVLGECLKIATSAPPEKGKANRAVAIILAGALGVDRRGVQLISGPSNPRKEFLIVGVDAAGVRARLSDQQ